MSNTDKKLIPLTFEDFFHFYDGVLKSKRARARNWLPMAILYNCISLCWPFALYFMNCQYTRTLINVCCFDKYQIITILALKIATDKRWNNFKLYAWINWTLVVNLLWQIYWRYRYLLFKSLIFTEWSSFLLFSILFLFTLLLHLRRLSLFFLLFLILSGFLINSCFPNGLK